MNNSHWDSASNERDRLYREEYTLPSDPPVAPPDVPAGWLAHIEQPKYTRRQKLVRFALVYPLVMTVIGTIALLLYWLLEHPEFMPHLTVFVLAIVFGWLTWMFVNKD
jgi:hypothetical protein